MPKRQLKIKFFFPPEVKNFFFLLGGGFLIVGLIFAGQDLRKDPFLGSLAEKEILRFAVIGDPHIDEKNPDEPTLNAALDKVKKKKAEFVVIVGDITESGKESEFKMTKAILEKSGLDYYLVPGDHDRRSGSLKNFEKYFDPSPQKISRTYQAADGQQPLERVELFLLNLTTYQEEKAWGEQLNWLKQEMSPTSQKGQKAVFVFQHFPPEQLLHEGWSDFKDLFCQVKIDGLFYGHMHKFFKNWQLCQENGEFLWAIPHVCPGAIVNVEQEFKGFLLVHYFKKEKIEVERVLLENPKLYDD